MAVVLVPVVVEAAVVPVPGRVEVEVPGVALAGVLVLDCPYEGVLVLDCV